MIKQALVVRDDEEAALRRTKGVDPGRHHLESIDVEAGVCFIQDGQDGFLANTTAEWVEKVARLVEDADLRRRMGEAARRTVEQRYSLQAWRQRYVNYYNELIGRR